MNNLTTMTYTSTGRVQTLTDANDHTTTYQYDSQDRLTTTMFPDGTTNLDSYNSQGNVIKSTDGRGNSTTYSYDALNRETGTTDALGNCDDLHLRRRRKPDEGPGADAGRLDRANDDLCL